MIAGIQQGHRQGLLLTLKYFKLHFYGRSGQKLLEKHPDKYKKVSRIDSKNGFDLTNRNLTFPLHVPLKVKYVYAPRKPLFVDHRKDIDFNILQGNEVLLAFEDLATLTSTEILMGLERLAIQPSQESHNWNEHVWIKAAFEHIKGNQALYKQVWTLRLYNVMKQLNNTDPEMWKLIYGRVEKGIFRMKLKDFIYFWETYHNDSLHFSREFVEGLFKLMEIKLRSFPEAHIIKAMHIMEEHGRITHFYTHNVFLPLFKAPEKKFNAPEMNEILKILMLYNIEKFERFYEEFYPKLLTVKCESSQEAREIKESLVQMQDIFQSHILAPYIEFFEIRERELKNKVKAVTQKQLYEIVQSDLDYFREKLKMQKENK